MCNATQLENGELNSVTAVGAGVCTNYRGRLFDPRNKAHRPVTFPLMRNAYLASPFDIDQRVFREILPLNVFLLKFNATSVIGLTHSNRD